MGTSTTVNIVINGRKIKAESHETILAAARRAGVSIPTLCYMEGLLPSGACRICVVEVEGMANLVTSCSTMAAEGMKIQTHSARVLEARKIIVELLLASHPDDCLYCSSNGKCELQKLARDLNVVGRRFNGSKTRKKADVSHPSLVRDPNKCILCGRCVRVCEEIQTVAAIDFTNRGAKTMVSPALNRGMNVSSCIGCGQCIVVCPTGALVEQDAIASVEAAINDPDRIVMVQHAPSISVSIGEELGLPYGTDYCGAMTAALRRMGFDRVFDTSFSADLTIMEEGSELVDRIKNNKPLPMLTSCSPGWIKFIEQYYPGFLPNVSTCKSPQQMMGALIKSYYAEANKIDPKKIFSVSIMPCTAKKFEATRPEMAQDGIADIDAVLTTRELGVMLRKYGIDLACLPPELGDSPLKDRSSAGKIFGVTGGVMEAALRSVYFLLTGKNMENLNIKEVRDLKGIKEAKVQINGLTVGVAVASGLGNARKLLDEVKEGRKDLHFIEIMTCPGGCIAGGGQPKGVNRENVQARMKALYSIDGSDRIRTSHENPEVLQLYKEFLVKPLGKKSHHLLHTSYAKREDFI